MPRRYETLGRRLLGILAEGGPRKANVLRALARSEQQFQHTIARLQQAGRIVRHRERGRHGVVYALAPTPRRSA